MTTIFNFTKGKEKYVFKISIEDKIFFLDYYCNDETLPTDDINKKVYFAGGLCGKLFNTIARCQVPLSKERMKEILSNYVGGYVIKFYDEDTNT